MKGGPPAKQPGTANQRKRILLVDDHPLIRESLAQRINSELDLVVCGEAADAPAALAAIQSQNPDLAIVDIALSGKSGLDLIKDIKVQSPKLPVIVLSMHDERLYAERSLRAGAQAYVMKQENPEAVLRAIRQVLGGH